jgi:hypothetical protein
MEDVIDLAEIERPADVLLVEVESRLTAEMSNVFDAAREQVVRANDGVAIGQ